MPDNCNVSGVGEPNLYAPRTLASPTQHLDRPHSPTSLESGLQATQTVNQAGKSDGTGPTYQLSPTPHPNVRNISLA